MSFSTVRGDPDPQGLVYLIEVAVKQDNLEKFYKAVEGLVVSKQIVGAEDECFYED